MRANDSFSANSEKAVEILCEHERSMAASDALLADVTSQQSKGSFVFDDPMSSFARRNQFLNLGCGRCHKSRQAV